MQSFSHSSFLEVYLLFFFDLEFSALLVRGAALRFGGLFACERRPPLARVDAKNEALPEGLDDVHHIRAEVPDHIELAQQ